MSCQAVVTGKPFAELKCRAGFTKVRTQINKRNDGRSVAVCIKRAAAGTPLSQLLGSVSVHPDCAAVPGGLKRIPGNLNSYLSRTARAHFCVSSARALRP